MFKKIRKRLLYILLSKELGVTISFNTPIDALFLERYSRTVLKDNNISCAGEALIAWATREALDGVGKRTWDNVLAALRFQGELINFDKKIKKELK